MEHLSSYGSVEDFDYSDESFEDFEEIQDIVNDRTTDQTPSQSDIIKTDLSLPSDTAIFSAIDIIDTFILSQIDFLNQIKEIAIQNTINK